MTVNAGTRLRDIAILPHGEELFGSVASVPTAWRAPEEVTDECPHRVAAAWAAIRVHVWEQMVARHGPISPCRGRRPRPSGDTIVTRLDGSIEQPLITVDGAGSSYALVDHITVRRNSATVRTSQKSPGLLRTDPAGDQLESNVDSLYRVPMTHCRVGGGVVGPEDFGAARIAAGELAEQYFDDRVNRAVSLACRCCRRPPGRARPGGRVCARCRERRGRCRG
jgi:hypothetical protein